MTVKFHYLLFSKHDEVLPKYFHHLLLKKKLGLVTAIAGSQAIKTGSGKSYTALRLGEVIDKNFSIEKVVYSPSEFFSVMDKIEESGKKGQVVVVDEGEITAPARLWHSFTNMAISYTLSTFRYLCGMAIFVTPAFGWLDKRIRILTSHIGFTEKFLDTGNKVKVALRLYQLETDLMGEKIYLKKIQMYSKEEERLVKFSHFLVNLPNEKLIEEYEKKSVAFKSSLRKNLEETIEKFKKYEKGEKEENEKNIEEYVKKALENEFILQDLKEKNKVSKTLVESIFYNKLSVRQIALLTKMINMMWKKRGDE